MSSFFEMLEKSGPFTVPLCFGMAFAINWLLKRLGRVETSNEGLQSRVVDLIERRADAATRNIVEYKEHVAATRDALDKLVEAVRG
jgi:hypothetical protein